MSVNDPILGAYVRQLRWALSDLPEADRDSIVAEMRSHVLDRVDAGVSLEAVLAALGSPNDYADAFCESYEVAKALSSRKTPKMLRALLRGWSPSTSAVGALLIIMMAWGIALHIVFVALLKLSDPVHVGLWRGRDFFFVGIIEDPSSGTDLLGAWIGPIAFGSLMAAWFITHRLAIRALKAFEPQR
jgi:hypothetical protein